jgi:hypothetical protein
MDGIHDTPEARARALGGTVRRFAPMRGRVKTSDNLPPGLIEVPLEDAPPEAGSRDGRRANGADRWPEPLDVFGDCDLLGAPPLRHDYLPDAISGFALDTADRIGIDPAASAVACLVTAAAAIPETWRLQPKRYDTDWTERACLWGANVGDPSVKKSPVVAAATKPLDALEAKARERHNEELAAWSAQVAALKREKAPPEEWPPKPRADRYIVENATVEALSEVLRTGEGARFNAPLGKVLVRQDELTELIANMDRYRVGGRGGGDRGAYLRLYNGGPFTVDRIQRGSFTCPSWSACLIGGIQPEPLRRLAVEGDNDGLLQRFILIVPGPCDAGSDRAPDSAAAKRYRAAIAAATTLHPPVVAGERAPPVVIHADGHAHRERIDRLAEAVAAMPDASPRRRSTLGKWPGLFARLLLTFHVIELADHAARGLSQMSPLVASAENARRVAALMEHILLPHMLRAERVLGDTAGQTHAAWIAGHILANPDVRAAGRITARDVVRAYGALRPPEARPALLDAMSALETFGWLAADPPRGGSPHPTSWRVNPNVFSRFAERAAAERERRERVKATLATLRVVTGG